jgi:hypothetical protein
MTTQFSSQATVCFALMLGSEAVSGSSIQITTFSVPVPIFGDTSAVEGVLTAARNTASGGLAGW